MIGWFAKPRSAETAQSRRGSALLVVLVMLGTIAALAAVISRSVSGAAREVSAARISSESEADLRAGIVLGVATILKLGKDMRSADAAAGLAKRRIIVHVTNERARIDLNMASASLLTALLQADGLDESEASRLATNIVDWRGGSATQATTAPAEAGRFVTQLPGFGGVRASIESESRNAPTPTAGSRFFLHPMQLASVPGFTKKLVKDILPLLTIASGSGQIDPTIATAGVLRALPGTSPSKIDAFIEARDGNTSRDTAIQLLGVDKNLMTDRAADGWRLQIISIRSDGQQGRSEGIVAITQSDQEFYRVLYVLDEQDQTIR